MFFTILQGENGAVCCSLNSVFIVFFQIFFDRFLNKWYSKTCTRLFCCCMFWFSENSLNCNSRLVLRCLFNLFFFVAITLVFAQRSWSYIFIKFYHSATETDFACVM